MVATPAATTSRPVCLASSLVVNQNAPSRHMYQSGRARGRPSASTVAKWHKRGSARNASSSSGVSGTRSSFELVKLLHYRLLDEEQAPGAGEVGQVVGGALGRLALHVRREPVPVLPRQLRHAV